MRGLVLTSLLLSSCGSGPHKRILTRPDDFNKMMAFPSTGNPVDIRAIEREYPELKGLLVTAPEYIEEFERMKQERRARGESVIAYRLSAGTRVEIEVEGEPTLSKTLTIPPTGEWRFPYIGRIRMEGLGVEELERSLTARLKKILKDPVVRINVLSGPRTYQTPTGPQTIETAGAGGIVVLGVITTRFLTNIPFTGGETLVSVLGMTGLPGDADWRQIRVIRRDRIDPLRKSRVILCDMWNYVALGDVRQDIPLFPGDVIYVPKRWTLYDQFERDWDLVIKYLSDVAFLGRYRKEFKKGGAFRD